jgi:hypothetical protein
VSRIGSAPAGNFGELGPMFGPSPFQEDVRKAAIFWGAAERLDEELGPTQWRTWKPELEALLDPAVLDDAEGLGAGRGLPTAEAVEMALVM